MLMRCRLCGNECECWGGGRGVYARSGRMCLVRLNRERMWVVVEIDDSLKGVNREGEGIKWVGEGTKVVRRAPSRGADLEIYSARLGRPSLMAGGL